MAAMRSSLNLVRCFRTLHSQVRVYERLFRVAGVPLPVPPPLAECNGKLRRWCSGFKEENPKTKDEPSDEPDVSDKKLNVQGKKDAADKEKSPEVILQEKDEQIASLDQRSKELKDKYLRAVAETENMRKRMTKQVEDARLFGIQRFSKDILEVADILEKAMESVPKTELESKKNPSLESLFQGLQMTDTQLQKVFEKNGLKKINPVGEVFDPNFHDALFEVPGNKPGTVAVVSSFGYVLQGRTIRPAKVGVVKATETTPLNHKS